MMVLFGVHEDARRFLEIPIGTYRNYICVIHDESDPNQPAETIHIYYNREVWDLFLF